MNEQRQKKRKKLLRKKCYYDGEKKLCSTTFKTFFEASFKQLNEEDKSF
jgi:hypothetical protein